MWISTWQAQPTYWTWLAGSRWSGFLYISSGSVYGDGHSAEDVLHEDIILYPRTLYAATKYASELLTRRYGELHGFQTVSVRLSSPYGPMERVTGHRAGMSIVYQWTGSAVRGEPIRVGDRSLGAGYNYVDDAAAGICMALDASLVSYDVYNISAMRWTTLQEVIDVLQELCPSLRVVDDLGPDSIAVRPSSIRLPLDPARAKEDLGFIPKFDLSAGIGKYLNWRETFPFRD